MSIQAKAINEQTPWQDLTPGGEHRPGGAHRRVALRRSGLGRLQVQTMPSVRPLLPRLLHSRAGRAASGL